jgi:hypothetical protein
LNTAQSKAVTSAATTTLAAGLGAQTASSAVYANAASTGIGIGTVSSSLRSGTTEYGKTYIKTARSTIDLDELGDMMDSVKNRLLILTPTFEKLEKYPMLKAAYDEFKMLEKLLGADDVK